MRTVITALATLGMIISSALTAVLVVGAAEGVRQIPDPVATALGATVFLAGMALAGRVAVDVGGPVVWRSLGLVGGLVFVLGLLASNVTEGHGEGLEAVTVAQLVAGLVVTLGVAAVFARRGARRAAGDRPGQAGPTS